MIAQWPVICWPFTINYIFIQFYTQNSLIWLLGTEHGKLSFFLRVCGSNPQEIEASQLSWSLKITQKINMSWIFFLSSNFQILWFWILCLYKIGIFCPKLAKEEERKKERAKVSVNKSHTINAWNKSHDISLHFLKYLFN